MHNAISSEYLVRYLTNSGKALAEHNAGMVLDKNDLLKDFIALSYSEKNALAQRASRVVSICCCRNPELIQPYRSDIIKNLAHFSSEGAIRNYLKIFSIIPLKIPPKEKGILINACFDFLTGKHAIALKVYSMEILFRLSNSLPEIGSELSQVLLDGFHEGSAGYKSRARKILRKLKIQLA
jgi:hypothetical protein